MLIGHVFQADTVLGSAAKGIPRGGTPSLLNIYIYGCPLSSTAQNSACLEHVPSMCVCVCVCVCVYGEGNGTPLQYSCLENPMDGGAW